MKQAICSDIHGDMQSFNIFLSYAAQRKDIEGIVIAGDIFGMAGLDRLSEREIRAAMNQQYTEAEQALSDFEKASGKYIMLIAGNYDSDFITRELGVWDLHEQIRTIGGLKFAGYGGHNHRPYKAFEEITMGLDEDEQLKFLKEAKPDIVITHSRAKEHLKKYAPLLSITGHTHTFDFFYNESSRKKRTICIKPGALGQTRHNETGKKLPQTFVVLDYSDLERAELHILENERINSRKIKVMKEGEK